jgi:hypothetical protein
MLSRSFLSPHTFVLAVIVAAVVAVLAGSVSASNASAGAADPPAAASALCPTGWTTQAADTGVALCHDPSGGGWDMHVIDMVAGGKMRLVSERVSDHRLPNAEFRVMSAWAWGDWIATGAGPSVPSRENLFGVVNAGFLYDTDEFQSTTRLSLPQWRYGDLETLGMALWDHQDAAWTFPKRVFELGNPGSAVQWAWVDVIFGFADNTYDEARARFEFQDATDGTVGFIPTDSPSDATVQRARTFASTDNSGQRVYITTARSATIAEVNAKLSTTWPSSDPLKPYRHIQFDGGRSAQWFNVPRLEEWSPFLARNVPEVLAIYSAD